MEHNAYTSFGLDIRDMTAKHAKKLLLIDDVVSAHQSFHDRQSIRNIK